MSFDFGPVVGSISSYSFFVGTCFVSECLMPFFVSFSTCIRVHVGGEVPECKGEERMSSGGSSGQCPCGRDQHILLVGASDLRHVLRTMASSSSSSSSFTSIHVCIVCVCVS